MPYNYNSSNSPKKASATRSNRTFSVPIYTKGGYIVNKTFSEADDPYVYPGTRVLINDFDIMDYDELRKKECEILKDIIPTPEQAKGRIINMDLLRSVHRYYFKNIYSWAGEFRTVPLFKEEEVIIPGLSLDYTDFNMLEIELKPAICALNAIRWKKTPKSEIAEQLAKRAVEIWKVHPFRDGNTRATLGFVQIIAIDHNIPLDMSVFTKILSRPRYQNGKRGYSIRDMFLEASLPEKPEDELLIMTFKRAMGVKE